MSSKQDRTFLRTPTDLERKYDFALLGKTSGIGDSSKISQVEQALAQYVASTNAKLVDLQEQIDNFTPTVSGLLKYDEETESLTIELV